MCYELGPLGSCPLSVRGFFPQSSDKTHGPAFSRTQCTMEIVVITGKYFYWTSLKASNKKFSKGNYLLDTPGGLLTPEQLLSLPLQFTFLLVELTKLDPFTIHPRHLQWWSPLAMSHCHIVTIICGAQGDKHPALLQTLCIPWYWQCNGRLLCSIHKQRDSYNETYLLIPSKCEL